MASCLILPELLLAKILQIESLPAAFRGFGGLRLVEENNDERGQRAEKKTHEKPNESAAILCLRQACIDQRERAPANGELRNLVFYHDRPILRTLEDAQPPCRIGRDVSPRRRRTVRSVPTQLIPYPSFGLLSRLELLHFLA